MFECSSSTWDSEPKAEVGPGLSIPDARVSRGSQVLVGEFQRFKELFLAVYGGVCCAGA